MKLTVAEIKDVEKAQALVDGAVNVDTGEYIPRYMRMCSFVPFNVPILCGMLLSAPTMGNTAFW